MASPPTPAPNDSALFDVTLDDDDISQDMVSIPVRPDGAVEQRWRSRRLARHVHIRRNRHR